LPPDAVLVSADAVLASKSVARVDEEEELA